MRWKRSSPILHELINDKGELLAEIKVGWFCDVKTKNRRGGWNYASAGNVRSAKAKAKRMLAEEAM